MRQENKNWAFHQNDPDNWLHIPEFGILPATVRFEGFSSPILGAWADDFDWKVPLWEALTSVRNRARQRFSSVAELKEAYRRVIHGDDTMFDSKLAPPSLGSKEVFAFRYFAFIASLDLAIRAGEADIRTCTVRMAQGLEYCAAMLTDEPLTDKQLSTIRSELASRAAKSKNSTARVFVQTQWTQERDAYGNNKSAFVRDYVPRVKREFGLDITSKQMRDVWLKDTG